MLHVKTPSGNVYYSEELIKNIVTLATMECNAVVGLANRNFREDNNNLSSGVKINLTEDKSKLNIHVFVIIKYGIKISIIANDIIHLIKDSIERFLELYINSIVVNVRGIRYEN